MSIAAESSCSGKDLRLKPSGYSILMLAPTSFFADYGCHVRILEEARVLQKLGHRVTIATYYNGKDVPGLDIRRTLPIPWRRHYLVGSSKHKIAFDVLLSLKTLELLLRDRYDVIHAHLHEGALIGLVLGRLFRVPVVFDFQGSLTGEMLDHHFLRPHSPAHRFFRWLEGWIVRHAPVILTSSAHAAQFLQDEFGCRSERIRILPDCVNTDVFRPADTYPAGELAALRAALGIPAERKLIVYLGLLAEYQGTGLLLEAMACILSQRRDVHLLLMGFPNETHYQLQARRLGIESHVTFTGRVPYGDAPRYLALGDVAVAPKLSLTEGAGKLLNYMAVGLPTVAFDTPVAREYLGGDGVLAIPGDVNSLADHLMQCLFPPEDEQASPSAKGSQLRNRATQLFGWDKAGELILETYAAVSRKSKIPHPQLNLGNPSQIH
ncbi:MAG: glycosyltransferase family 4 protein [Anaerolineae bacterium]